MKTEFVGVQVGDVLDIDGTRVTVELVEKEYVRVAWYDSDNHLQRCTIDRPFTYPNENQTRQV